MTRELEDTGTPMDRAVMLLRWCAVVALTAIVGQIALQAGGEEGRVDGKLFYTASEPDQLAWISAEMATSEDGSIDWDVLSEDVRLSYEGLQTWQPFMIGKNEDGSPIYDPWESHGIPGFGAYWGPSHRDGISQPPSEALDQLISNARYVVEGVVTSHEQGFFLKEPMTLLTLDVSRMRSPRVDDTLPPRYRTPMTNVLYVAYPSASFTIGGHGFAKGDPAYPPLPGIGDSILFFVFTLALDVDRLVFRPDADKVLVQSPGGELDPEHYRYEWVKRRDRVVPRTLGEVAEMVAQDRPFESFSTAGGGS